ncbi:hypothetical protein [Accumulibacter sp.]|uniref:hypothetical protein n=1 Tax=Accumulibacter sp. TaxID=2053492 RepID=UPI0025D07704|nr:hypothetical protein [Accumulibacter sp.]MCM8626957.1 hypothetical protein [Accumulibacter sp.]
MANTPAKKNGVAATIGLAVIRWLTADGGATRLTGDEGRRCLQPQDGGYGTLQSGCGSVA